MSRVGLLFVIVLVLLAGCNGIVDGDGTDREPYSVPEPIEPAADGANDESGEDEPEQLLPGLTVEGIDDVGALQREHQHALDGQPHTVNSTTDARYENGTPYYAVEQSAAMTDAERYIIEDIIAGEQLFSADDGNISRIETWENETQHVTRFEFENGSVAYEERGRFPWVDMEYPLSLLYRESEDITVSAATVDGTPVYVLEAAEPDPDSVFEADEPFAGWAVIDEDGLILQAAVEGTIIQRGETILVEERTTLESVGGTDVEEPPWLEEAVEELEADANEREPGEIPPPDDEDATEDGDTNEIGNGNGDHEETADGDGEHGGTDDDDTEEEDSDTNDNRSNDGA